MKVWGELINFLQSSCTRCSTALPKNKIVVKGLASPRCSDSLEN